MSESSIRFNLKSPGKPESLVLLIYRLNNEKAVISTGQTIAPHYWNPKKGRARPGTADAELFNASLQYLEDLVHAAEGDIRRELKTLSVASASDVKHLMVSKWKGEQTPKEENPGLVDYAIQYVEARNRKAQRFSKGTSKAYGTIISLLMKCPLSNKIKVKSVSKAFYEEFQQWMFSEGLSSSYVDRQWKRLKTILSSAVEEGLIPSQREVWAKLPISKQPTDSVYLSEEELEHIAALDLSAVPGYEKARDLFLFGAYTGLRFSDYSRVEASNIRLSQGKYLLEITQAKTNEKVLIPLKPKAKAILMKYGKAMPKMSNQKLNEYIKEVCKAAGLTEEVEIRTYKGGKKATSHYPKWQLVSSHTARRSFATNLHKRGVQYIDIMKLTGHKTVAAFLSYIKIGHEEGAMRLSDNDFFK